MPRGRTVAETSAGMTDRPITPYGGEVGDFIDDVLEATDKAELGMLDRLAMYRDALCALRIAVKPCATDEALNAYAMRWFNAGQS